MSERAWETVRIIDTPVDPVGINLFYAEFTNEEYVQVEVTESGQSVMWSTSLDLDATIRAKFQIFGEALDDKKLWSMLVRNAVDGPEELVANPAEIDRIATTGNDDVTNYSAGYADKVLFWRAPQVKLRNGTIKHCEIAYSSEAIDREKLCAFMGATATPQVIKALELSTAPIVDILTSSLATIVD